MMRAAGDYSTPLVWLKKPDPTARPVNPLGERSASRTSAGVLWCHVEDLSAARVQEKGGERQKLRTTVRVRNLVGVRPGDGLEDPHRGELWEVLTARRGVNETVCEVER